MACVFIVDEEPDNARQLSDALRAELAEVHDIRCVQGLADYRLLRRQHKPALILVELLRLQSNGFSLAAALAQQSSAPVVLLSDRDSMSDRLWASARGIAGVVSRRCGRAELAQQVNRFLQTGLPLPRVELGEPHETRALHPAVCHELMISPQAALLSCLAEELQPLPTELTVGGTRAITSGLRPLSWLHAIVRYVDDNNIRNAVEVLAKCFETQSAGSVSEPSWLRARESVLTSLQPPAQSVLLSLCQEVFPEFCKSLNADDCRLLRNAMTFLPKLKTGDCETQVSADSNVASFLGCAQPLLFPESGARELQQLIHTECLRIVSAYAGSRRVLSKTALRELCCLGLVLRAVTAPNYWKPVLDDCLCARYGWENTLSAATLQRLTSWMVGMLGHNHANGLARTQFTVPTEDCRFELTPDAAHKLQRALTDISDVLTQKAPLHQRFSSLMVKFYQLRSWFEFSIFPDGFHDKGWQRWRLLMGCLYEIACHVVLRPDRLMPADINDTAGFVSRLLHCSRHRLLPSDDILMNLAALEISISRRTHSGSGAEHQLLAAGLQRLPKPDCIVSDMFNDVQLSGTVLAEITQELVLLTEGSRRLGVVRIESLGKLILDCYLQLRSEPELLQRREVRLALGRAHRVLCRLLDQAAAWLPLDQPAMRRSVLEVIDELFMQFDHSRRKLTGRTADIIGNSGADARQTAWVQCLSLNRRLRQVARRSGNLSEYRSLFTELLREQEAVITPYLPYQSPD